MLVVVLVGVVLLGGVALALSVAGGGLPEDPVDAPDPGLPDRLLTADDVPRLRFRTVLRGYRMSDVDTAMDRLAEALRAAEARERR